MRGIGNMMGCSKKHLFFVLLFVIASTGCTELLFEEDEFNKNADEFNALKLEHNTLLEEMKDAAIAQDEDKYIQKSEEYEKWATENRPKIKEYEKYYMDYDSGSQEELDRANENSEICTELITTMQENLLVLANEKRLFEELDEFSLREDDLKSLVFEHDSLFEEINEALIAKDDDAYVQKVEEYRKWIEENRPKIKEHQTYFSEYDSDIPELLELANDNYAISTIAITTMQENLLIFMPETTTVPPVTTRPPMWYDSLSEYEINSGATTITYENLIRDNEQYSGTIVSFKGQVLQIIGSYDVPYGVLIYTKMDSYGNYNDEMIYLVDYDLDTRLIEGDIITIRGVPDGFYSYEMVGGGINTVPQLVPLQTLL